MIKFQCMLCGQACCYFRDINDSPLIFPWEKRLLLDLSKQYNIKLEFKPFLAYKINDSKYAVIFYRWIINGRCPFLSSKGLCTIHDEKPYSCKMFPLIVGIDDNTLRASGSCLWVNKNIEKIRNINSNSVFEKEYKYAIRVFIIIKLIEEVARSQNWKRIIISEEQLKRSNINLIDIDNIIGDIEKTFIYG